MYSSSRISRERQYARSLFSDKLEEIPSYNVPKELVEVLKNLLKPNMMKTNDKFWTCFIKKLPEINDIDECDFFEMFKKLLYLEECYSNDSLDNNLKKKNIRISGANKDGHFTICLNKNDDDDLSFLKEGNNVDVQKIETRFKIVQKHSFEIIKVSPRAIILEALNYYTFKKQHTLNDVYFMELDYSNWPIRVCQFALELLFNSNGSLNSFFLYNDLLAIKSEVHIIKWFNETVAKNPEQIQAVKRIVGRSSYPSPYLVFGPPGTGKTATIVEAVCQINKRGNNVLICTPSNAAADEITRRLLKYKIPDDDIYRMTSKSVERKNIPNDVKICMNFERGGIEYLHSSEIKFKKIVIATLVSSARFLRLGTLNHYFNYIFIDEAGQATKPETMIPFAITKKNFDCQIVMSGDPKQLGPVVMTKHGEHLLEFPNFITKLVQNYRSHETILRLPNDMFYDGELVACAGENVKIAENWTILPKKKFPIIFHAVHGYEEINSLHSVANEEEAKIVIKYVEKLLDDGFNGVEINDNNIGIVTPFRSQTSLITEILNQKELFNIAVGTVESFQGQEKDIIIVSLVRSAVFKHEGKYHVGFLSDEKRFNVTITRAKSLLIVIGHPKVLQIDNCWRAFIKYCKNNDACCGDNFEITDSLSECELKILLNNRIEEKKSKKQKNSKLQEDFTLNKIEQKKEFLQIPKFKFQNSNLQKDFTLNKIEQKKEFLQIPKFKFLGSELKPL
ncbi:putative helicase mov-10-B.2 [Leptopilina boulardi]|uniref:putative helicase mov-10-B.2 n=1 Tax=Leptopilina boulardi TaxID=63433 RepID=UPI0021F59072|nr:putative helicase mov-10-B.2 [Leptopilina boulardi]